MKVLCLVSPWSNDLFKDVLNLIDPDCEVLYVSDFLLLDESGLTRKSYEYMERTNVVYSEDREIIDIVSRCRLLRQYSFTEAVKKASIMRELVAELINEFQPDMFLSETVDQFLKDILFRECEKKGIFSVGLVRSFVNGYFRLTIRGEINLLRKVEENEIDKVIEILDSPKYLPSFVVKHKEKSLWGSYAARSFKHLLRYFYFKLKIFHTGEKYNYHYLASSLKTPLDILKSVGDFFYFNRSLSDINSLIIEKKKIFIPLQFFPEATIDYWCEDNKNIQYESRLFSIIEKLNRKYQIFIKEHPGAIGFRSNGFYKKISEISGVSLIHPYQTTIEHIDNADCVFVWTGSAGFEALLRGKPVVSLEVPYYAGGPFFKKITMENMLEEIESHMGYCDGRENSALLKRKIVGRLLEGNLLGVYRNDGSYARLDPSHSREAEALAASIKNSMSFNGFK